MPRYREARLLAAAALDGGPNVLTCLGAKPINLPQINTANPDGKAPDWTKQIGTMDTDEEWRTLYADLQQHRADYWELTVRAFEANPCDFYNAYHYLDSHPAFYYFHTSPKLTPEQRIHERHLEHDGLIRDSLTVMVVKVDPDTNRIEDDKTRNTKTAVWIEMGKRGWPKHPTDPPTTWDHHWHDIDLDCGADTYEQAIIVAAVMLHTAYGNDREICDKEVT